MLLLDLRPETLATLQPSALFKCACELGRLNIALKWHTATIQSVPQCLHPLQKNTLAGRRVACCSNPCTTATRCCSHR